MIKPISVLLLSIVCHISILLLSLVCFSCVSEQVDTFRLEQNMYWKGFEDGQRFQYMEETKTKDETEDPIRDFLQRRELYELNGMAARHK